jgi:hypothetical protein
MSAGYDFSLKNGSQQKGEGKLTSNIAPAAQAGKPARRLISKAT